MGRLNEHIKTLEKNLPIVEELGDKDRLAEYYFKIAWYYGVLGNLENAIHYCTKSIELCELTKNHRILGLAYVRQGYNYWYKGEFKKAFPIIKNSIRILEKSGDHYWVGRAYQAIGMCYWQTGDWHESITYIQKALKKSEDISDNNLMTLALWSSAVPHIYKGQWNTGIKYCERCLEMSPPQIFAAITTGFLGIAYYKNGQLEKGIEFMEQGIELSNQFGMKFFSATVGIPLAELYLSIGERDIALQKINSALIISKESGFSHWEGMAYRVLGEIKSGADFNKAKEYVEDSIKILKRVGAKNELAKSYLSLGTLYKEKGEKDKAKK
jgi:tetratricopeptide (TPR) repeat protein